jgi:hypothetical protein
MLGEKDLLRLSGRFPTLEASDSLLHMDGVEVVQADEELITVALKSASSMLPAVFSTLEKAGAKIHETTVTRPSLESLFIKLTGSELRE